MALHMLQMFSLHLQLTILMEIMKASLIVTTLMKERLSKGLPHKVSTILMMMTILTRSILILRMNFGVPFQETETLDFMMGGPQRPDTMGMNPAEEEATMKKY
jgi:hypothetical protein